MKQWKTIIAVAGLGLLGMPLLGADLQSSSQPANFPNPGTLNYVEGEVYFNGVTLTNQDVAKVNLLAGQELTTGAGKAEILLSPGVVLRMDSNSAVKMISPSMALTQVELEHGRAGLEVDWMFKKNEVQIVDNGVTTQPIRPGYYEFDANQPKAMVFKGKAEVLIGGAKQEALNIHHDLALAANSTPEKTADSDSHPANDELYNWSSLRSQYLAEANSQIAGEYTAYTGFKPGWYWDPYMGVYTYLGRDLFYSPFGWGFHPWGGFNGYDATGFYG